MALDSYANLKTALATFADVTAADISAGVDDIVRLAENQIFRDVRCKEMEQSLSDTITVSTVPIPSNYLDLKFAYYLDSTGRGYNLRRMDAQWMRVNYPEGLTSGRPEYIGAEGSNFIFKSTPDDNYIIHGVYYGTPDPISTSANALFARYPDLYLFKSLVEVERFLKRPDQMQMWEQRYRELVYRVNLEGKSGEGYAVAHYL